MIVSFRHKGLKLFFTRGDMSHINPSHAKKLRLVLGKLHAVQEVSDMNYPGSNLHPLYGEFKSFWSVSISGGWRLIFQFKDGEASVVDYLNYH